MKTQGIKKLSCFMMLILCLSVFTGTAEAAVVWEEDFEAGMGDWTILGYNETTKLPVPGNFSDAGGVLTSLDSDANIARHNSTMSVGTWSFDLFVPDEADGLGAIDVMFMSNGTRPYPEYRRFLLKLGTIMIGLTSGSFEETVMELFSIIMYHLEELKDGGMLM